MIRHAPQRPTMFHNDPPSSTMIHHTPQRPTTAHHDPTRSTFHHTPKQSTTIHHAPQWITTIHNDPIRSTMTHHAPQWITTLHNDPVQSSTLHYAALFSTIYINIERAWSRLWSTFIIFPVLMFPMLQLDICNNQPKFERCSIRKQLSLLLLSLLWKCTCLYLYIMKKGICNILIF